MLTQPVMSDSSGSFSISDVYTCGQASNKSSINSPSNQVYLVATGGNPGLAPGSNNGALVMMAALGSCSNLSTSQFIFVDEVTTVAAAWALAPFASSYASIGSSATNPMGIENAFLDANLLANTADGMAATLPSNLTIETGKLYALADALANCVNSDGGSACSPLFSAATPSGGSAPADTFSAALNIVRNPGWNVAAVYAASSGYAPYATTLTKAPNDWTMSLTITGGGLSIPTALGVDSQNNVWVANQDGPLSVFNAQGSPLSSTGFGEGDMAQTYGLAIDTSDNVWVTNYNGGGNQTGSVTEFYGASSGSMGSVVASNSNPSFDTDVCYPTAIASDPNGTMFIANEECSSATVYDGSANVVDAYLGQNFDLQAKPLFLAVDANHGFWLSDNDNTIAHISAPSASYPNGQLLSHPTCCYNSHGVATDANANVWVANYLGSSFSEVSGADGSVPVDLGTGGGVLFPYAVAVDADQNVWFTNFDIGSISEIAGTPLTPNATRPTAGTPISPSTGGIYGIGGYGLDAALGEPFSIAPDRAGNVWVSNEGQNTLVMFFGLAVPTVTPLQPVPTAP
jgi:hypothetical protein